MVHEKGTRLESATALATVKTKIFHGRYYRNHWLFGWEGGKRIVSKSGDLPIILKWISFDGRERLWVPRVRFYRYEHNRNPIVFIFLQL